METPLPADFPNVDEIAQFRSAKLSKQTLNNTSFVRFDQALDRLINGGTGAADIFLQNFGRHLDMINTVNIQKEIPIHSYLKPLPTNTMLQIVSLSSKALYINEIFSGKKSRYSRISN